jgi:hypothetical protein
MGKRGHFGNSHRAPLLLGGKETARIPGAREPKRLFLVGWEVNIQLGSLGKLKNNRTRD